MKQGWEIKKLKEGCRFVGGYTPSPSLLHAEGHIPYFKVSDMNRDGNSRELYNTKLYLKEAKKTYPAGAIVFPKNGGAVLTNKKRILVTNSVVDLNTGVAIPNSDVNVDYLYYFFCGVDFCNFVKEGTLPVLKIKEIGELPIFLPHLEEQERIVEILDREFERIDALKANAEQNLQHAKDLFQAALKQELQTKEGWETKTISEISENLDYKRVPVTKKDRKEGVYPYYGASGIVDYVDGYLFDEDLLLVSEDGANLLARSTPIAFSVSGKIWVNNHAHILRFANIELQKFVEYFFANYDISKYVTGAAQPKFNQKALNNIVVSYPTDIVEQRKVVSCLDKLKGHCSALEENYKKTIALCDDMKQALLRKAFNGEL